MARAGKSLLVRDDHINTGAENRFGVVSDNGQEDRCLADRDETNALQRELSPNAEAALRAIGGWVGLDWDETIEELERIRRESKASPPPSLDDL